MILNGTTTWDDKDLTTEVTILSYTAVRDSLVWVRINAGRGDGDMMDAAGANPLTARVYRDYKQDQLIATKALDTTGFANKSIIIIQFEFPIILISGETVIVSLLSANANDTQVDGEVYLADHHAKSYSTNDYPEVDAVESNAATFLTQAEVQAAGQSALEANNLHLVDANGSGGVAVASDGLDNVATTEPAGVASDFREMVVQLWRRFFVKSTATASALKTYKDDDSVCTTQTVSFDGTTKTVDDAA